MPKLKGLLDTAKAKLTGLLGDFPQGFNAGAVAGFPGWAGDMAYMADTARLALTGADQQAAPENYVGTTEYIAKQAGFPVPQTLSGQLGAAVGGLMSPGPGDLAKFAPVLSAIPFWHGSPHKFDRFDLAHMGKGEGAQAYGWGAYGAESPEVANQYRVNLSYSPDEMRIGGTQINEYYSAIENKAARMPPDKAAKEYDKLAVVERLMSNDPVDEVAKYADEVGVGEWFNKEVGPKFTTYGHLYKGEYRWPDPQKEAATPLTGEDLLQWDRPLSEQPESVRRAVSELGIVGGNMELPAGGLDMSGGGRILDNRDGKVKPESVAPYVLVSGDAKFDISEKDLQRMLGGSDDPTGEQIYTRLTAKLGDQNAASKALGALGAPGIRYLDGMSRDGGQGTYNYVMFDDKGIKLLERNGSPIEDFAARRAGKAKPYREAMGLPMDEASRMQRAGEMGFDTPAVHWSRHGVDVSELDSGKFAIAPFDAIGTHTGTPEAAMKRFEGWSSPERGAGVTYPVLIKNQKPYLDPEGKPWNEQKLTEHLREIGGYDSERADYKTLNAKLREKIFSEYDSIPYINDVEDAGSISYITPPQNIRSRWAAFDPKNKDSANLLAGTTAAAVGLGAYKRHSDEQRRRRVD